MSSWKSRRQFLAQTSLTLLSAAVTSQTSLAQNPPAVEARWNKGAVLEILYAALQQARGAPGSTVHAAWRRLLMLPRYTTHALIALSPSFEAEVEHLAIWWEHCPARDRPRELRQRITRAWKTDGEQRLREALSSRWAALPDTIRRSINIILGKLGFAPICALEAERYFGVH